MQPAPMPQSSPASRPAPTVRPAPTLRPVPTLQPATPQLTPTAHVSVGIQQGTSGTARRHHHGSPPPEVVGRLSNECKRQLRVLEETQAETREHDRELMEEVRGLRSAHERIARALELLVGALVPGHATPTASPQPPPPSP
ncbi:uncharacterized protein LOC119397922 [Rhipicephalus sanguineus]|uniref:uncharacterized protein LOC119397922 n=1 Tax=Rhipicephalus sanguineus TaxID=34632 RepID=UPI0020C3B924|nr:uncharacterized protein LOC119397922 [Rhipicephalus sanguineus]